MEIIKTEFDANYNDRICKMSDIVKVWCLKPKPNKIIFDVFFKGREDDSLSIIFRIDDLLEVIGKVITQKD